MHQQLSNHLYAYITCREVMFSLVTRQQKHLTINVVAALLHRTQERLA